MIDNQCPNCKEPLKSECACLRNKCIKCGDPVGNITFTFCDSCYVTRKPIASKEEDLHSFIIKVLQITAFDNTGDIFWKTDGEYAPITFFAMCNDTFHFASSDCEKITPENIGILEQSYKDSEYHGGLLFCARVRSMRPLKCCYKYFPENEHKFFDASGPPRTVESMF